MVRAIKNLKQVAERAAGDNISIGFSVAGTNLLLGALNILLFLFNV